MLRVRVTAQFSMYSIVTVASLLLGAVVAAPTESLSFNDPHYAPGHDVMVHLMEWKWNDIAEECERFLGPMGFGGIQVSPITENVIVARRPWWERYQPLSYIWNTRSGNENDFRNMVRRCNRVGVRIYVDALLNHMSGDHKIVLGTAGSTGNTTARLYPEVPYGPNDFNRLCAIHDYNNAEQVRNCELVGLHDLNQRVEHVREKMVEFLNAAINAGVAGFRIDAAKHMWPEDLRVIYSRLHHLNPEHGFPKNARPYIYQEVIDLGGEGISKYEYNSLAAVTEFRYGLEVSRGMKGNNPLKYYKTLGESWNMLPSNDALVFIDNHDNQRGHGGGGGVLTHKQSKLYKMATAFMLAHPYGKPKLMSSFAFENSDQGPPADKHGNLISPVIKEDLSCEVGWICEHRWRQIYNMVRFRNTANGTTISHWWDNGNNQIAFSRGDRGFIAINADKMDLKATLQTKLPAGTYCDIISGNKVNGICTGKRIVVDNNGNARVEILLREEDGVVAIHRNAKL